MTDTPTPQNSTPEGQAANKTAWERLQSVNLIEIDQRMQCCKHAFTRQHSGVEVCAKCGQTAPIIEAEAEYW